MKTLPYTVCDIVADMSVDIEVQMVCHKSWNVLPIMDFLVERTSGIEIQTVHHLCCKYGRKHHNSNTQNACFFHGISVFLQNYHKITELSGVFLETHIHEQDRS